MKKYMTLFLPLCLFWSYTMFHTATPAFAETAASYEAVPPFVTAGANPNVLLNLSIETPMQGAAYNDQLSGACAGRVNDGGTSVGRCYFTTQEYLGIFDPKKEYVYDATYFKPVGLLNADHSTKVGGYSGNFLNWATMTAIDEFRWALTGGRRTTDTTALTVIARANMTLGLNHSWYPLKRIKNTDNVAPGTVTPFTGDNTIYIYNHGYQLDIGTTKGGHEKKQNLNVRAKVCDPAVGLEDNCVSYSNGAYYKPEGLIQNNADRMRFAVMSYAYDSTQSRGGGVLRANMKYVGPTLPDGTVNPKKEYGTDGIYIDDPDDAFLTGTNKTMANSGVINYVNKFGKNGYKSYDPVGELFYECLNYFKHRGRTPEYADGLTLTAMDEFPVITDWDDPIESWCQSNFIVGINDANPWLDKKLPGTYFTTTPFNGHALIGGDYGTPGNPDTYNVKTLTNTVGALQGINGTSQCIGCTAANCDMSANNKNIPGLGEVMGTCPYPGKENSYYVAGLAYYANTTDIRPELDMPNKQTVSTFMIDTQEYSSNPLVGQMNMLWLAGKYGGFNEKDNVDTNLDGNSSEPNLASEWDANSDGEPDNYVLATDPDKLITGLARVFNEIQKRSSSGTAASVISGSRSGEGAIYQSVFYPEYSDTAQHKITWAGSVHASFVDELGRMREDTPDEITGAQNHILDEKDKVFKFDKDILTNTLTIKRYSLVDAVAEVTNVTFSPSATAASLKGNYFLLYTVGEKFYVWFTVDGSGSDPRLAGTTGISVALATADNANEVATKTEAALDDYVGTFTVSAPSAYVITITNTTPGDVTNAASVAPGVTVSTVTSGVDETTPFHSTVDDAEDIDYLWNSNTWLNGITDTEITTQRNYSSTVKQRYIFTFIDADQDKIADPGETRNFVATSLPTITELADPATIYPYIPVNSDSETLPTSINGSNLDEFLQNQTQRVINYTRGQDQGSKAITAATIPAFRSRKLDLDNDGSLEITWRLGDIVYSSPTVVSKPQEALHLLYKDTSYGTFAAKYQQRRTVLYTGANDGMLHAFNGGFYEDRFDVYPPLALDKIKDKQFLLQPKDSAGLSISTFASHDLGAELWAYIPYNLLPHLYWPTEPSYGHVYYVDLKPRIFDAKIFFQADGITPLDTDHPGGWGTVLVGGMRFGGGKINVDMNRRDGSVNSDDRTMTSAYYILDITNPEVPPTVLGEINFPNLGYTTCYPTIAAMKDKVENVAPASPNRWFLIFGSGPAEADGSPGTTLGVSLPGAVSNQKAKLYVVDLVEMATNKLLKTLNTSGALTQFPEVPPAVPPAVSYPGYYQSFDSDNNAFISDPITVDYDLDYKADAVYFGTQSFDAAAQWGGRLRRIVMDNDIDTTSWEKNSTLIDLEKNGSDPISGIYQPISAAPSVGLDLEGNNWVYFGTGRYFIRNDKNIDAQQTFYGIKEPKSGLVNNYTEVSRDFLYNSTEIDVDTDTKEVSGGPFLASNWNDFVAATKPFKGWYYNFTDALERNVGQAALFGDLLTFTSYLPSDDICTYEGSSYLYALYYLTGTAPSSPAIYDSANSNPENHLKRISLGNGLVSKPSIHVGRKDGSTVFVQTSDGAILTLEEDNPGLTKSGRTAWGYKE